jgi:hypothetical protein
MTRLQQLLNQQQVDEDSVAELLARIRLQSRQASQEHRTAEQATP